MGIKQIPTPVFLEFLTSPGLIYKRTKASHFAYDYPDGHVKGRLPRQLIVRTNKKEIPLMPIHSNLVTLKVSKAEFEYWLRKPEVAYF